MGITDTFVVDSLLKVSHITTRNDEWDINKLQNLVNSNKQLILAVSIPFSSFADSIYWGLLGSRESSTKSAT